MLTPVDSPYRVPFDGTFHLEKALAHAPRDTPGQKYLKKELKLAVKDLRQHQEMLYAQDEYAVLLVFQAMDAAGKDGTIRAILSGVNPAGCQVTSFKQPSANELDHDYLWRTALALPERGRIGVFNRSYYEEVLVVRVHPEYLGAQKLPHQPILPELFHQRFESIRDHERHLARNGTVVLKFWLNVSYEEQRERFLERLTRPDKNWKFSSTDVRERGYWNEYMQAYEEALAATSRPWAPWYAIPADDKHYMRCTVIDIVNRTMKSMGLSYPEVSAGERERFDEMQRLLEAEASSPKP
ncbi:MAG: polyphosphate kinase 2 family protein [Planctomycetes bacterium]|nr:polyphosphate kinase 2 family protein [Planctomycetota bacterium]MCB9910138.1 polyphosphate kinase 2 family protein [Planctomycetota bacterium]MCB9913095.1 polyphosphate kinase 2 family protein [Planctomycetota bacterium]HPF14562.1 polyphosphate kinase 2 family protein [Planctomycetota bacterium]HRV82252.1 polyphosphate kinase 2 family protein [Planctomycetota bacterium]